ncbi:MAG: Enoyl-CoA hydratase/isomerase [Frankiales bacterium]|nr:Enoyl-CoA hydratase/isomerase [Frankiales bacterium]
MAHTCFTVDVSEHVAHVQLARPEALNSMTVAFYAELAEIVDGISDQATARVIVLSSTGRHFTAGMDLSVFGDFRAPEQVEAGRRNAAMLGQVRRLQRSFSSLERARVPVIAAVQGGVIGGGVDLVTAADIRYASVDAFFCIQEINIGLTADLGTLQRLGRLVPDGVARELAFTGRRMTAQRAYDVGLVQQVLPDHEALVEAALATAREIAAHSPLAVWGTKVAMNHARDHSVADSLEQVATWQTGMFQPDDMAEVFAAREQGRPPVFPELLPQPHD